MRQKRIGDILYVFQVTPYQITEDTDASTIKVQEESYPGFKELNESLADKIVKYNYKVVCITQQEWMPYINQPDPEPPVTNYYTVTLQGSGLSDETVLIKNNGETVSLAESYQVAESTWFEIYPLQDIANYTLVSDNMSFEDDPDNEHWYVSPSENMAIELNYSVQKQDPELAWSANSATVTIGETNTLPTLANPNNISGIYYETSNDTVADINDNGDITLRAPGNATISAVFDGDETYNASTVSYDLTVEDGGGESGSSDDQ